MSDKTFRKHPKISKFVCIKSSLQFLHNLYPFLDIPRYLKIPLIYFCETLHNGRQAPKECAAKSISKVQFDKGFAKTIVTSLLRDIYSDRPKNNIILIKSMCNTCVITDKFFKY